jgi:hypothetical protein
LSLLGKRNICIGERFEQNFDPPAAAKAFRYLLCSPKKKTFFYLCERVNIYVYFYGPRAQQSRGEKNTSFAAASQSIYNAFSLCASIKIPQPGCDGFSCSRAIIPFFFDFVQNIIFIQMRMKIWSALEGFHKIIITWIRLPSN